MSATPTSLSLSTTIIPSLDSLPRCGEQISSPGLADKVLAPLVSCLEIIRRLVRTRLSLLSSDYRGDRQQLETDRLLQAINQILVHYVATWLTCEAWACLKGKFLQLPLGTVRVPRNLGDATFNMFSLWWNKIAEPRRKAVDRMREQPRVGKDLDEARIIYRINTTAKDRTFEMQGEHKIYHHGALVLRRERAGFSSTRTCIRFPLSSLSLDSISDVPRFLGLDWHGDCRTRVDVGVPGANILRSAVDSTKALEPLSLPTISPAHDPISPWSEFGCNLDLDLQAHDPSQARIPFGPPSSTSSEFDLGTRFPGRFPLPASRFPHSSSHPVLPPNMRYNMSGRVREGSRLGDRDK
ncbi:hypothetical protein B0H16DRAFT_1469623 [Mycena metata]|uniref:Uncharacterized protein n=1 Tax=Mycena metata TaxID=1033252 RepID=A0AAD7HYW5_9AGAR|nr:hypothetical protein B0H16DRAFT_1469623 [Mycena metata]